MPHRPSALPTPKRYSLAAAPSSSSCTAASGRERWPSPPFFTLHKVGADLTGYPLGDESYDVIYYDAFAPEKQPELWSAELLGRVARSLRRGGVLSTYCAKGEVRRRCNRQGSSCNAPPAPRAGNAKYCKPAAPTVQNKLINREVPQRYDVFSNFCFKDLPQ